MMLYNIPYMVFQDPAENKCLLHWIGIIELLFVNFVLRTQGTKIQ